MMKHFTQFCSFYMKCMNLASSIIFFSTSQYGVSCMKKIMIKWMHPGTMHIHARDLQSLTQYPRPSTINIPMQLNKDWKTERLPLELEWTVSEIWTPFQNNSKLTLHKKILIDPEEWKWTYTKAQMTEKVWLLMYLMDRIQINVLWVLGKIYILPNMVFAIGYR